MFVYWLKYETALILDGLKFYGKAIDSFDAEILQIFNQQTGATRKHGSCVLGNLTFSEQDNRMRGFIVDLLKRSTYEGLTGHVAFDEYGHRQNFGYGIYKIDYQVSLKKVLRSEFILN